MVDKPKLSQYLTTLEAAEKLGVSDQTLRKWTKKRRIDLKFYAHPATGKYMYLQEDIDRFLEETKENKYVDI